MSSHVELARCGAGEPSPELMGRVAVLLAEGALVALPTETVYGIAARADSDAALGRLHDLKGRASDHALTWHVGSAAALERFASLAHIVTRLAARYWPGPLTLVLAGVPAGLERVAHAGWTGVRQPAHPFTGALLAALDFPVVLSSANASGAPPALDAADVARRLGAGLALVVDGGRSRLGQSSSVLRVGPGRFELLREGILPLEDLRRTAGLRIAFCCTGNTCRSPMAEALARVRLARALGLAADAGVEGLASFGFEVRSMGVAAAVGEPASPAAVRVVAGRGGDLCDHRSQPAILAEARRLDRIYCMTAAHQDTLRLLLPPARAERVELLDPDGRDIADPIGGDDATYAACADQIEAALALRTAEWI